LSAVKAYNREYECMVIYWKNAFCNSLFL